MNDKTPKDSAFSILGEFVTALGQRYASTELPRVVIDVDGGFPDVLRGAPTALLEGGNKVVLGSVAIIGDRWALTASHCVTAQQSRLSLFTKRPGPPQLPVADADVDAIYWQNGDSYRFKTTDKWPAAARDAVRWNDQIVLLHLNRPVAPFWGSYATLPGDALPERDDFLIVAGFGQDDAGNLPEHAQVAVMRYLGPQTYWRGGAYRDRHVVANGSVRSCDSGGPVFMPDISSLRGCHRLIGIHSCRDLVRDDPKERDVALFLPLSGPVQSWIKAVRGRPQPVSTPADTVHEAHREETAAAAAVGVTAATKKPFYWRNGFYCYTLVDDKALDNPVDANGKLTTSWMLSGVTTVNGIFSSCDEVEILPRAGSTPPRMRLVRNSGGKLQVERDLELRLAGSFNGDYHWFESEPGRDGVVFFLFLLTNCVDNNSPRRGIRLEAFLRNTAKPIPSTSNIQSPVNLPHGEEQKTCDLCIDARALIAPSEGEDHIQDDEANGYEKPR
jgi:hypothetical protein